MLGNEVSMVQSLIVTVFSMGLVFLALIVISFILDGFKAIFYKGNNKDSKVAVKQKVTTKTPMPSNSLEGSSSIEDDTEDEELIAVITAAIAATLSKSTKEIRIKAIRRVPQQTPVWARAGRQEQMYQ